VAIITAGGLFHGERLRECSLEAQLFWHRYFVASNTCCRLELNYQRACDTAYVGFRSEDRPSEEKFWAHIQEYKSHYLLFIYEADGSLWGQWDTAKEMQLRHQLAADKRTPEPPPAKFAEWKEEYRKLKLVRSRKGMNLETFVVVRAPAQVCESPREFVRGVDRGGEVREGLENLKPSIDSDKQVETLLELHPRRGKRIEDERGCVDALIRESAKRANDTEAAFEYLRGRTELYRKKTQDWPPGQEKYIKRAGEWFATGLYAEEEKFWERGTVTNKSLKAIENAFK
jgi:hypothetical protein